MLSNHICSNLLFITTQTGLIVTGVPTDSFAGKDDFNMERDWDNGFVFIL